MKSSLSGSSENLSTTSSQPATPASPKIHTNNQLQSPRSSTPGARTVAAALKSVANLTQNSVNMTIPISTVVSTRTNQVTSANIMSSPTGATIRFQLQQYQLQQLQQQQKQLQQKLQAAALQSNAPSKPGKYTVLNPMITVTTKITGCCPNVPSKPGKYTIFNPMITVTTKITGCCPAV